MSGISVVGRDYYGVSPLKGNKPLNVREASVTQVMKNEEIKDVIDIMGLKFGTVYDETNVKTLRYGHLMIMADQDHDGSHIKELIIINFAHPPLPAVTPQYSWLFAAVHHTNCKGDQGQGFQNFLHLA